MRENFPSGRFPDGTRTNWLNFGNAPDHSLDPRYRLIRTTGLAAADLRVCFVVGRLSAKVKGKLNHAPQESVDRCSSPSSTPWAHRWRTTNVCGAWPVWCQTYGCLPSCKASLPIGWYQIILLGDRGACVLTICPGLHSTVGGWDSNPRRRPTATPPSHTYSLTVGRQRQILTVTVTALM